MAKLVRYLVFDNIRQQCARWCKTAPQGTMVTFTEPKRTTDQNSRMWAMLTDISRQVEWHGQKYSTDDWKILFIEALGHELRMAPSLFDSGYVNLGRSSSRLSKAEMSDLIELMFKFGATHGVEFNEPEVEE